MERQQDREVIESQKERITQLETQKEKDAQEHKQDIENLNQRLQDQQNDYESKIAEISQHLKKQITQS